MSSKMQQKTCDLCSQPANLEAGEKVFCCHGCMAVFEILQSLKINGEFREHPIYLQAVKHGMISNPHLHEQIRLSSEAIEHLPTEKLYIEIEDLWCPSCAALIQWVIAKEKGIKRATVDYTTDLAVIEFAPKLISKEKVLSLIEELGYHPIQPGAEDRKKVHRDLNLRFGISAFCAFNIMMFAYPVYAGYYDADESGLTTLFAWLSLLFSLPLLYFGSFPILQRAYRALKHRFLAMESLVSLGVIAAFSVSTWNLFHGNDEIYYDSMAVIIALVLLGKIIELKAKFSAKETLYCLVQMIPKRGRKYFQNGQEKFIPLKQVEVGDVLVTYPGEKIVLDGVIFEGEGSIDESVMTGEAIPRHKKRGDKVIAGSILQTGHLKYQVMTTLKESTLYKLIELVEEEIPQKSQYIRGVDKIIPWFVPVVLLIALTTWATTGSFIRALTVLIIACPCAIGIAVPLVESMTMHGMAALGALIRNRGCLAVLGTESRFVFDKTGTVTEGVFSVQRGLENLSMQEKQDLKGMCARSIHPISAALDRALDVPKSDLLVEEIPGFGLKSGNRYLGSSKFLSLEGKKIDAFNDLSLTTRVYFYSGEAIHEIELGDKIRPEVSAILRALGSKTFLLSGDHQMTTAAVANACGFGGYAGGCHPLMKRQMIEDWKQEGEIICFIGDGMNDAAPLAAAHVGISVANGSDMSMQVADVVLTTHDLQALLKIRQIATKARRLITQNLFWAFGYNVIGIGLAVVGLLTPLYAAIAMMLSSLTIVWNSQRPIQKNFTRFS